MTDSILPTIPPPPRKAINTLAITSLVTGILAFLSSFCVIGILFAIVGLIAGIFHLREQEEYRGMAIAGIALSGLGGAIGSMVLLLFGIGIVADLRSGGGLSVAPSVWIGTEAPNFVVTTIEGETINLSDLRGKRVIVDVWATWCPPCRMEIPHFNQLRAEFSKDELVIIGVTNEETDVVRSFLSETPIDYPIATFTSLPPPFGDVSALPTTFFIDADGMIDDVKVGYHDYDALHAAAKGPVVESVE